MLAAVMVITLAACVGEVDVPEAEPTANETATPPPVFASEEEALAAAVETYEGFLAQSDQILAEGGAGAERIDRFLMGEVEASERAGYAEMVGLGLRTEGSTKVTNAELQSFEPNAAEGKGIVRAYACVDVSGLRVFDRTGALVDVSHRPNDTPFELAFDLDTAADPPLVVSEKSVWLGHGVC